MLKTTLKAALVAAGLLAGGAFAAHAQTDYAAIDADPAMWTIERDGTTVHLLGTYHILPSALDWRTEQIDAVLEEADTIWFEADVHSAESQQQMQALIPQLGLNPSGTTLSSLLDEETNALLAEVAPMAGATPAALEPMQPWLAALMLAVGQIQALGYDANSGVETVLRADAVEADKDFGYFETAEQQLRFFADQPTELQVEWLEQSLHQMEELPEQVSEMTVAWATGDTDALDAMINGEMREDSPEIYETIIVGRNEAWIPQIEAIFDEGGTHLVAVGAGHMTGEQGVIALLEARGYEAVRR